MFEIGTATDYHDLATKLATFLETNGSAFGVTYTGTGTGTFTGYRGGASSVAETWEVTATSATSFTVVGSLAGSVGPATVGTPFSHAKIAFLLTAGGTAFVAGDKFTLATAPKWTRMLGPNAATSTKYRINFGVSGGGGFTRFSRVEMMLTPGGADQVAGSGGTASASSNTGTNVAANAADTDGATHYECTSEFGWWQYEFLSTKVITEVAITSASLTGQNAPLNFTIDLWTGSAWTVLGTYQNESSWGNAERRVYRLNPYIWKAPGNDGLGEVYVGIHTFQNSAAGWYNWRLGGFTAFNAGTDFFNQPGGLKRQEVSGSDYTVGPILPLANSSLGYWFVANGRRVMGVVKSGSTYGAFYLGLIQPYASPGTWPLPLFVGGSLWWSSEPLFNDLRWGVGNAHDRHTCFVLANTPIDTGADLGFWSSGMLRKPDGGWLGMLSRSAFYDMKTEVPAGIWPYAYGFTATKPDLDGAYSIMPAILIERSPNPLNVYGQFDGVQAVTGSGLTPETNVDIGRERWIAFPDCTRSTAGDFFVMKMD